MILRRPLIACYAVLALATVAFSFYRAEGTAPGMRTAARDFLDSLDESERALAVMPFESPQRVGWHFIPKDQRKGLQLRDMSKEQRQAATALLRSTLSQIGFRKARAIMRLEKLLAELERDKQGGAVRDHLRYYVTVFGKPGAGRWGLSIEGHHLSLNFVVENDEVVSSTPAFFAANPGEVKAAGAGIEKGRRVLKDEELLAFELVQSLDDGQRERAVIAEKAPREIRAAGEPQPPTTAPEGLSAEGLQPAQQKLLKRLIGAYARNMPDDVAMARLKRIEDAGIGGVHFAWAGARQPGIGHYYRIQGPSFLIEFVNTQPDAAGNPANHIHCVWRDMQGDFSLPVK